MKVDGKVHSGHRERTIKKFLISPEAFAEHEVLETLLFYALPRVDTNPLAHRLIRLFGSLSGVFNATKDQLLSVEGVGEKVATYILAIARVVENQKSQDKKQVDLDSTFKVKEWLKAFFMGKKEETFVILMLDKKYKLLAYCVFTDKHRSEVKAEIPEVITAFNVHKPNFAIVAHNHPSSVCQPSSADEFTTKKLNVICELNDVNLLDHIIVAGDDCYSYRQEGKLDFIKDKINLNNLFNEIK